MNTFRVTFCPGDFPDLQFSGIYPSDDKISGHLTISDSACNAFNFVCLSELEPEVLYGWINLPTPIQRTSQIPQDSVKMNSVFLNKILINLK